MRAAHLAHQLAAMKVVTINVVMMKVLSKVVTTMKVRK
jgi:hypothetical protein